MYIAAMPAITYREHLDLFYKYKVDQIPYKKLLLTLAFSIIISLSFSLRISSHKNKQVIPVNEQAQYFQSAGNSFYKSKQTMDELRASLQVAGAKTLKVDLLKEASPAARVPGFFTTLSDIQKTIDFIKLTRGNIANERTALENINPPQLYLELDAQIIEYMGQSEKLLTKMENDQFALKEIVRLTSPIFFLPTLSEEEIWESGDIEKIKAYYQKKLVQARQAQELFSIIETDENLKSYKGLHISHLLLVINLSENIISTLERPIEDDEAKRLELTEEAYQILIGAKRESEGITFQLQSQRVNLTSLSNYSDDLASLGNRERIITSGLLEGIGTE